MVTRVTTSMLYRDLLARVGRVQRNLADAQAEVSSQRRIRAASDDPTGAAAVARLRGEQADGGALVRSVAFAKTIVGAQDNALERAGAVVARLREIASLAANGTSTPASRAQVAVEVSELERELIALGNTEVAGRWVFAGRGTGDPPFTQLDDPGFDPDAPYVGSTDAFLVRTGEGQTLAVASRGDEFFAAAIAAADDLRTTLEGGGVPTASIDALAAADDTLRAGRAIVGSRARTLAERETALRAGGLGLEAQIGAIEGADLTESITRLVQLQTALQATIESGRALQASLLDAIRL